MSRGHRAPQPSLNVDADPKQRRWSSTVPISAVLPAGSIALDRGAKRGSQLNRRTDEGAGAPATEPARGWDR